MKILASKGRLGNQIFQLQFIFLISRSRERIILIGMNDLLRTFKISRNRVYILDKFIGKYLSNLVWSALNSKVFELLINKIISINIIDHNTDIKNSKNIDAKIGIIKSEFYQHKKYLFPEFKNLVTIRKEHYNKAISMVSDIPLRYEKVFIHVRRGDYKVQEYQQKSILLPTTYYKDAINIVENKIDNPFFIFLTDDHKFVIENFSSLENIFISRESESVDLAIMTLCRYGVMSNSTFSWWGSSLMRDRKFVIAPKYWWGWRIKQEFPIGIIPNWAEAVEINS